MNTDQRRLNKARQIFLYIAPFPSLAFFKIWGSLGQGPAALFSVSCLMLLYCSFVIWLARRWDRPSYFDWTVAVYFAMVSLSLLFFHDTAGRFLQNYSVTGIYACLFTAAFLPPVLGMDPFTYHYAKKYTPEMFWGNPVFVKVNLIMTYVWAAVFALCIALSLYPSVITRALIPLGLILGFGIPFNLRFPNFYLKRLGLPSLAEQKNMASEGTGLPNPALSSGVLPTSAREAISGMPLVFNPEAAADLSVTIAFIVSGSDSFERYLKIDKGTCELSEHSARKPDLVIRTPADVWLGISRGELDGQTAFMNKSYTAEGNLGILLRMKQIFSRQTPAGIDKKTTERLEPVHQESFTIHASGKEKSMKVLALNSSPRGDGQSKTELMLTHLVNGMREAGAEVEVVELRKKSVKHCIGCFTCWTKTPGVCIHKDDMTNELFPKWRDSDLVIYATPLYHFTLNATMKAFIERTLPFLEPYMEDHGGETSHPARYKHPKVVFLSVAGFPEISAFGQLSSWANFVFGRHGILVAEIYRPMAESMKTPFLMEETNQILNATVQAGREIVQNSKISPETLTRVTQPVVDDPKPYFEMANLFWKTCIAEGVSPKEFEEKGLVPRPDSVETFMLVMPMGFNPAAAGDTRATIQFKFSDEAAGSCYFKIENGKIQAAMGLAEKPDLTIEAPFSVWMDIMTRKADGQQMFMEQKYKVIGDLSLLLRMNELFGRK
jgi:multimeric flavodoxin WrbA/putative sterol carrier protein